MSNKTTFSKDWAIKNGMVLLMILAFFICKKFVWTESSAEIILNGVVTEDFHGKIDSVYHNKSDHNTMMVRLSGGFLYGIYSSWESKVELGDSLSKRKGSLIIEVFKKDKKTILNYKELVKNFR